MITSARRWFQPAMIACAAISLTTLAACGPEKSARAAAPASSSDASDASAAATGVVVSVATLDNTFRPQTVEAHVGDTVEWENRGHNEHNVLSIEGSDFNVDVTDFQPGAQYTHVFTEPGEYAYYCSIHGTKAGGMTGTVTVLP